MQIEQIIATLLVFAAVFTYLNERFLKVSATIGMLIITLLFCGVILVGESLGWFSVTDEVIEFLNKLDFRRTLMDGLLGFLLFAGAMHIQTTLLAEQKWAVCLLAIFSTLIATLLIALLSWLVLAWIGFPISFIQALVFGALISPTDPIAAVAILKQAGMPRKLETLISGESLFNDGVAAVLFSVIAGIAISGETPSMSHITWEFTKEVAGGIGLGLLLSYVAFFLVRGVGDHASQLLITLALVSGGGVLARALHVSNPLAMVVAGLCFGHWAKQTMDQEGEKVISVFWKLVEDILNAVLFMLLGFFVLADVKNISLFPMLIAIPIVLVARFVSVIIPVRLGRLKSGYTATELNLSLLLTWGGLRGAISIALVLSLPESAERNLLFEMTFAVVVFSLLIQGLTIGQLFSRDQLEEIENLNSSL